MTKRIPIARRAVLLGTLTLFAVLAVAGTVAAAPIMSSTVKIGEQSDRYLFGTKTTFVNVGGTVTWSNGTDAPHTVTSDSGSELQSPHIAAGGTFHHTFSTAGTFAYHCTIHPYMTASVVVLAPGATPPATNAAAPGATTGGSPLLPLAVVVVLALGAGAMTLRLRLSR